MPQYSVLISNVISERIMGKLFKGGHGNINQHLSGEFGVDIIYTEDFQVRRYVQAPRGGWEDIDNPATREKCRIGREFLQQRV